MSKARVKAWKRGMETANALDLEQAKRHTPDERFWALIKLMQFALSIKRRHRRRPLDSAEDEVAARWAKLRKANASQRPSS